MDGGKLKHPKTTTNNNNNNFNEGKEYLDIGRTESQSGRISLTPQLEGGILKYPETTTTTTTTTIINIFLMKEKIIFDIGKTGSQSGRISYTTLRGGMVET